MDEANITWKEFFGVLAVMAVGWVLVPWEQTTRLRSLIIFIYLVLIAVGVVAEVEVIIDEIRRWRKWRQ